MPQSAVDPLEALLKRSPLSNADRAKLWNVYEDSGDPDALAAQLDTFKIPPQVKSQLWTLKSQQTAPIAPTGEAPAPEGSAVRRFASNAGELLNPVSIATGLYQGVRHPLDTGSAILSQSGEQFDKAIQSRRDGRYTEAAGHLLGSVPVLGPIAAQAGEQIGSGDVAGGLGKAAGLLAPFGVAEGMARVGLKVTPATAAAALERGAAARVAEVIAPKSSTAMGRRMGAKAAKIAPELVKRGDAAGWSREGLQATIAERLANATEGLDAATDARLAARTHDTAPVVDALRRKLEAQSVEAVDASVPTRTATARQSPILDAQGRPIETVELTSEPLGRDVIPRPNQPRAGQIQQAIKEVKELGPVARYESLRDLRQAYDTAAQTVYNPSVTADYLKVAGEAKGAADVTGTLRDYLSTLDPVTAKANLDYSLYKSASDILKATEEIEKARPKVGRQIMSRLTGSVVGGQQAGAVGAVAGFTLGPLVEQALSAGFTTKLQTAKLMNDLAKAITTGDVGRVTSWSFKARQLVKQAEAVRSKGSATLQPNTEGSR